MLPPSFERSKFINKTVYTVRCPRLAHEALVEKSDDLVKNNGTDRWRLLFGDVLLTRDGKPHAEQRLISRPLYLGIESADQSVYRMANDSLSPWARKNQIPPPHRLAELVLKLNFYYLFQIDIENAAIELNQVMERLIKLARHGLLSLTELFGVVLPHDQFRFFLATKKWNQRLKTLIAHPGVDRLGFEKLSVLRFPGRGKQLNVGPELNALLAGFDTTAKALMSSLHIADQNPKLADQLTQEALHAGSNFAALKFTNQFFKEVLRLHPPVKTLRRYAKNDLRLGEHKVAKGAIVLIDCAAIQRHPASFVDAEHFIPERWQDERSEPKGRLTFFPFGAGSHRCLGEAFARRQSILSLAAYFGARNNALPG